MRTRVSEPEQLWVWMATYEGKGGGMSKKELVTTELGKLLSLGSEVYGRWGNNHYGWYLH